MKVGAVVVVKETGELGVVEASYPTNEMWCCEVLEVRTSEQGETNFMGRSEVTQLYKPRRDYNLEDLMHAMEDDLSEVISYYAARNPTMSRETLIKLARVH